MSLRVIGWTGCHGGSNSIASSIRRSYKDNFGRLSTLPSLNLVNCNSWTLSRLVTNRPQSRSTCWQGLLARSWKKFGSLLEKMESLWDRGYYFPLQIFSTQRESHRKVHSRLFVFSPCWRYTGILMVLRGSFDRGTASWHWCIVRRSYWFL